MCVAFLSMYVLYKKFYKKLFHVKFNEEQLLSQTLYASMLPMGDICKKTNFGGLGLSRGEQLHRDCSGLSACSLLSNFREISPKKSSPALISISCCFVF
jgi:hypothetical protein